MPSSPNNAKLWLAGSGTAVTDILKFPNTNSGSAPLNTGMSDWRIQSPLGENKSGVAPNPPSYSGIESSGNSVVTASVCGPSPSAPPDTAQFNPSD